MIDLQRFAEEQADQGNNENQGGKPTFTDEQQKYIDGLLSKRLARAQEKAEAQAREKAKAEAEAQKLAALSESEKQAQELKSLKEQLNALSAERAKNEMLKATRTDLSSRGYSFSDSIVAALTKETAEETKSAIDGFVSAFEKAVQDEVRKAVRSTTPKGVKEGGKNVLTKAEIMAVKDKKERQRLINQNLNLFRK